MRGHAERHAVTANEKNVCSKSKEERAEMRIAGGAKRGEAQREIRCNPVQRVSVWQTVVQDICPW